jgi:DNA-binding transcriptional LysR family regulator
MSLGSVEAIKQLVGAGLGCAVLPGMSMRAPRERKGIVVRPLSPRLHRTLALVVRRDKPLAPALRETLKALRTLAG